MPRTQLPFWSLVDKGHDCWIWLAGKSNSYGTYRYQGRMQKAHRISWKLVYGEIPAGLNVLHKCDNPPCVRLDHLYVGSASDNMKDAARNGKFKHLVRPGESNHNARLTLAQVREIRSLWPGMLQYKIAEKFGVHKMTIKDIIRNITWKDKNYLPDATYYRFKPTAALTAKPFLEAKL